MCTQCLEALRACLTPAAVYIPLIPAHLSIHAHYTGTHAHYQPMRHCLGTLGTLSLARVHTRTHTTGWCGSWPWLWPVRCGGGGAATDWLWNTVTHHPYRQQNKQTATDHSLAHVHLTRIHHGACAAACLVVDQIRQIMRRCLYCTAPGHRLARPIDRLPPDTHHVSDHVRADSASGRH